MQKKLEDELDQLTDEEIEARLAAAVWVDDKRAAVLRYLEEKKLGKKKEARSAEFEIARNAKEAAWAALDAPLADQLQLERTLQRDAGRTADFVEGVRGFRERRPPKFMGR